MHVQWFIFMGGAVKTINTLHCMWWTLVEVQISGVTEHIMLKFCVKELGLGTLKCIVPSKHAQASMKLNLHTSPIGTKKKTYSCAKKTRSNKFAPKLDPSPHFVKHKHRRYFGRVLSLCFGNKLLSLVGKVSSRFGALSGSSLLASPYMARKLCLDSL
jgi:hypothetical protein